MSSLTRSLVLSFVFYMIWLFTNPLFHLVLSTIFDDILASFILGLLSFPILVLVNYIFIFRAIFIDNISHDHQHSTTTQSIKYFAYLNEKQGIRLSNVILLLFGIMFFTIGHATHYAANYLWFSSLFKNLHTNEIFVREVYVFDELLGHWFMITGLLLLALVLIRHNLDHPSSSIDKWYVSLAFYILSIPVAIIWTYFVLEGLYAYSSLVSSAIMILYLAIILRKRKSLDYPVAWFSLIFFLSNIICLVAYYLRYGDFIEPHLL